jgi:replicative DNA helicase
MLRNIFEDEYDGEKKALKVFQLTGKNGKTKKPVMLEKGKHYQILFVVKNREGSCNEYSIVVEHDMSKNTLKEVGLCIVPTDF